MHSVQFRMARAVLMQSIKTVAHNAQVKAPNLRALELGKPVSRYVKDRVRTMYEELGMTFHENEAGELSVLVKPHTLWVVEDGNIEADS